MWSLPSKSLRFGPVKTKRCEGPQCSVSPSPELWARGSILAHLHSAISFSNDTRHVLAPVGGLTWLCIELSCKKASSCFDRSWLNFTKVISSGCVCTYHISYLWPLALAPGSNIPPPTWHFHLELSPLGISSLTCLTPNSRYRFHIPPVLHEVFPISVDGTTFYLVAQAKKI